jgi:signal transduction histidine kinase/CheY-like chemotaxis protein
MRDQEAGNALKDVVDAAIAISGADFGNIQLFDVASSRLRIVAQLGFPQWWVDYWNADPSSGACHRAFTRGERVIIEDVEQSPIFVGTPALQIQRKAHVRAVQSTPILSHSGELLGVLSTHFRAPHHPDARALRLLDLHARHVADILERLQAEKALRESEARLRLALQGASAAAWQWNIVTGELIWSPESYAMHGRAPEQGVPQYRDWLQCVHPDDRAAADQAVREALIKRVPEYRLEYRVLLPSGEIRWLSGLGKVEFSEDGAPLLMAGINLDITGQKRAELELRASEAALRQSQERLHFAAESGRLTYVDMDVAAGIAYRAENYGQVMGYAPVTPFGGGDLGTGIASLLGHVAPEDGSRVLEAFRRALGEGVSGRAEFQVIGDDGRKHWIEGAWSVGVSASGKPERIFVTALDITERMAAEKALREADRRKDEFLAMLAHELRNPLASISAGLQLLQRESADGAKTVRVRDIMARQVNHLVRLVDDLLEVSRISRGRIELRKERIDLAQVVNDAVAATQPHIADLGGRLTISLSSEPLPVEADPTRLTQVFVNLLDNAAKFTEPGGRIEVLTRREDKEAEVCVRDSGVGISPDELPRVFELFTQVDSSLNHSRRGLGIGLALVRSLVEMHGGRVEARSEGVGLGSAFIVRLPLEDLSVAEASPEATPGASASVSARRVLVVDDDRDVADSFVMLLETLGAKVRVVYSGQSALEVVAAFKPELVFLDLGMPKMDGWETARRIRQLPDGGSMLLIAMTGWGQEKDRHRTREAGFDEHLVKPLELSQVQTLVARLR